MLHPQARALLDLVESLDVPPMQRLTPQEARDAYRDRRYYLQPDPPAVAEVREFPADTPHGVAVPLRAYRPAGSAADAVLPVLVYFHGGGWTIGDLETHDVLCRELANGAGCTVVSVDYRVAPEARFPAAVDDCIAATRWVRAHAAELKVDPARLAVGGDSAGGNLAAVVCIDARDAGDQPPIVFQLLVYPATDMRSEAASHRTNGQGYLLTNELVRYYHDHYIDDVRHDLDWRASPLLAEDLAGVPPAFVMTAGYDPLRDEGLAYAQRLTEDGVRTTHVCFERQIHGFITMGRVLDEANAAVAMCADELRRAFAAASAR